MWRASLRQFVGAGGKTEPPDFKQRPCPLEDDIWDEWLRAAGDLEKFIATWARRGVSLGSRSQSSGVFLSVEEEKGSTVGTSTSNG